MYLLVVSLFGSRIYMLEFSLSGEGMNQGELFLNIKFVEILLFEILFKIDTVLN